MTKQAPISFPAAFWAAALAYQGVLYYRTIAPKATE
jgi:hypothetical protein